MLSVRSWQALFNKPLAREDSIVTHWVLENYNSRGHTLRLTSALPVKYQSNECISRSSYDLVEKEPLLGVI